MRRSLSLVLSSVSIPITTYRRVAACTATSFNLSLTSRGYIQLLRSITTTTTTTMSNKLSEPIAKIEASKVYFGVHPLRPDELKGPNPMNPPLEREDNYFWLRDDERKNEEVIKYLNDENAYCLQEMEGLSNLKDELYDGMVARLKETDNQVPAKSKRFLYYSRTVKGLSYPIDARIPYRADFVYTPPVDENAAPYPDEEIILDQNEIAKGFDYSIVSGVEVSPDHALAAYGVDNNGYETYKIRIREIATGRYLEDVIEESDGSVVWGNDNSVFFYLKMDSEHRPNALWMHTIGTPQSADVLLLKEDDERFWMGIGKSHDEKYLFVEMGSKETSEVHYLDLTSVSPSAGGASAPLLKCFRLREPGHLYDVEHHENSFYIVTNKDGCKNFKLVTCADSNCDTWVDVKAYNPAVMVESVTAFKNFLAIRGRESGFSQLWIADTSRPSEWRRIEWPEAVYALNLSDNLEYDTDIIRVAYSSMVTPKQIIDLNMATSAKVVVKTQEVPGGYDSNNYSCIRMEAPAKDGTKIPMSVVFRKDLFPFSKTNPLLLYGYGSYGACIDPNFDFKRSVLLDRGIIYAIAHIRGGGEMGRPWYEDEGKYLTKMNTFNDMGSCAKFLIDEGITTSQQMATVGRSAGGLLMGAMANMYPHLFKCIVADVPFVDVCNTMSDPTIPLTVVEWEEWGNPNEEKFHAYMLAYSPYDNVSKDIDYPAILVTAGLNDPRVAYWEPAKWVAKMRAARALKTPSEGGAATAASGGGGGSAATTLPPLLLKTDMTSGHFSASDRYKLLKETAFEYAFIVDQIQSKGK